MAAPQLAYLSGFGNEHATEAVRGALPVGQNAPQRCALGLYAEQLSGSSFTAPRAEGRRSWLYRVRPSVMHSRYEPLPHAALVGDFSACAVDPNQMRWLPPAAPPPPPSPAAPAVDFVDGLATMAGSGDPALKQGLAIHVYGFAAPMRDRAFSSADGEMLLVPQLGALSLRTEMGLMRVAPGEIVVVPRGVKFQVSIAEDEAAAAAVSAGAGAPAPAHARGYVLEVFGSHFRLPELGPIGANGLANARDFLYPVAAFEDRECPGDAGAEGSGGGGGGGGFEIVNKFGGRLFSARMRHSPFDVVGWHGTLAPYKYDLARFNTVNTVSFDHPDPSIFTVLTCPSHAAPGTALADFVIFPPRWMVAEHTFRPPYFHRNVMSEFMGMIWGKYDAKVGFQPGGASLHSCMSAHGPDAPTFAAASAVTLAPHKFEAGLAFMFETHLLLRLTPWALDAPHRDRDYQKCWQGMAKLFDAGGAGGAGAAGGTGGSGGAGDAQ